MIKQFIIEQKNMLIGFVVVVLVFAFFIWLSQSSGSGSVGVISGASALTVEESLYDFGAISMSAGKVSHSFVVKNSGDGPVTLTKLYTSCMCTEASLVMGERRVGPFGMAGHGFIPPIDEALEAGQSGTVEVVFDPAAHGPAGVGKIERVVFLENDSGSPMEITFSATVTP